MKSRKFLISLLFCLFIPCAVFGGGGKESGSSQKNASSSANSDANSASSARASPFLTLPPPSKYWDGDGGKGMSIAILAPKGNGLAKGQEYIPSLVQGEFVSNFSGFSAISVLDRQSLDTQYAELMSGYYDDNAQANMDLGKLSPTDYIMGGTITKTATGYAMQISITKSADKMTAASYSGTMAFVELDNLSGVRRASLDLLQKMGVKPTELTKTELTGAAAANQVDAQTALAQGITAQKQGTEIAALSYYFQAAAIDPSLMEAANRSSILAANISSGNIGADIRNEIEWRKQWIARLQETETFFTNYVKAPPCILTYSTDIQKKNINWQNETVTLGFYITYELKDETAWAAPLNEVLRAVKRGLDSTGRAKAWNIDWPEKSATGGKTPFVGMDYKFTVVEEIVNDKGKSLGRSSGTASCGYGVDVHKDLYFTTSFGINEFKRWNAYASFSGVKVADITDTLAIKIISIDGIPAETAAKQKNISILPMSEYHKLFAEAEAAVAKIAAGTLKVGDRGPAGGFIFYDKGKVSDGWRYLEAAPSAAQFIAQWSEESFIPVEGTEETTGSGKRNTELIITVLNQRGESGKAAQLCANLNFGGKTDWFLPSIFELNLMYNNLFKEGLGGFYASYWSSTQKKSYYNYYVAFYRRFEDNAHIYVSTSRTESYHYVRAVRAF